VPIWTTANNREIQDGPERSLQSTSFGGSIARDFPLANDAPQISTKTGIHRSDLDLNAWFKRTRFVVIGKILQFA
jgi:hypothetical protein